MREGKRILFTVVFVLGILILFSGCSSSSSGPSITSPTWSSVDGWERFITNDADYYNYSFFRTLTATDGNGTPEVQIQKISGASNYGYGIIFAVQTDGSCYRFLIETDGYYKVSKININGGTPTTIQDWTFDRNIKTGYSTVNDVKVLYDSAYNPPDDGSDTATYPAYDIYVNGIFLYVWYYTDGTPMLKDGKSGFYVSVGDETTENFPGTPVDVRFKMTLPVTYP